MSEVKLKSVAAAPPRRASRPEMPLPAAAWAVLVLLAAALMVLVTTFRVYDPDLWQHLRVGRAIWESHAVPHTQVWVWPTYGQPDVPPSWLFRALLWPFWQLGEVNGLFAWRWLGYVPPERSPYSRDAITIDGLSGSNLDPSLSPGATGTRRMSLVPGDTAP